MMFYMRSVILPFRIVPSVPFYSSKGRLGLQGIGVLNGLNRSMALAYSRPLYRCGLELCCYTVLW